MIWAKLYFVSKQIITFVYTYLNISFYWQKLSTISVVYSRISEHGAEFVGGGVVERGDAGRKPGLVGGAVHLQLASSYVAVSFAEAHYIYIKLIIII